jgi:hypothetical protein
VLASASGVEGHKPVFYLLNNQPLVPLSKIFQNQKNPPNLSFCSQNVFFNTKIQNERTGGSVYLASLKEPPGIN